MNHWFALLNLCQYLIRPVHILIDSAVWLLLFAILFDSFNRFKNLFLCDWLLCVNLHDNSLFVVFTSSLFNFNYRMQLLLLLIQHLLNLGLNDFRIILKFNPVIFHVGTIIFPSKVISAGIIRKTIINTQCYGEIVNFWVCVFRHFLLHRPVYQLTLLICGIIFYFRIESIPASLIIPWFQSGGIISTFIQQFLM